MAYRNETDRTPDCLTKLMQFIENNTGLMGEMNPGRAQLSVGGTVVMITSDRTSFDSQSILLEYVEEQPDLRIRGISVKSLAGGDKHPHIEVVEA